MTYGHPVREAAFELYCQGFPLSSIAEELNKKFGRDQSIASSTIQRWAQRHGWDTRRAKIHEKVEAQVNQAQVEKTAQLLSHFENLRDRTLEACTELEYRSAEGAVRSLGTLQKVIGNLNMPTTDTLGKEQLEAMVETIFQVLAQDELLGPVLARRQTHIARRIEEQLAERPGERD